MQTKEYRTYDKSSWSRGEWDNEPDKKQWSDPATGLPCLIVRNRLGALCGYVGVPESHPCFMASYDEASEKCPAISVHGGLTFDGFCKTNGDEADSICHAVEPGENDRVWWLGFDCAHCMDRCDMARPDPRFPHRDDVYRNFAYVTAEVTNLAQQLSSVA